MAAAQPALLLSSDLSRARDTAAPLQRASGLVVRLDKRLRELDLGDWQGLTVTQAGERFPAEYDAWRSGVDLPRGGGETYAQAGERAVACLLEALPELDAGQALVAVTHGGTAKGVLGTLLEVPAERWWTYSPLGNACWTVLVEHALGWRLLAHGVGAQPGL